MGYLDTIRRIEENAQIAPKDLPLPFPKLEEPRIMSVVCGCCRKDQFWESIYGVVVCAICHPPGHPALVTRWVLDEQ